MINDRINAYIGITGFTDKSQVEAMLAVLREASGSRLIRKLGVGVMMSFQTLNGILSSSGVFPAKEKIAEIFPADSLAYNILHYADYKGCDILASLDNAARWGGPNLQAIQLEMVWPDPAVICEFKELHPRIQLIIQINYSTLSQVYNQPLKLVTWLKRYGQSLNGVLLDMSVGKDLFLPKNLFLSWWKILPHLACINIYLPDLQLAVAGGLGSDSLYLVKPLLDCFVPEIGIDAEVHPRPDGKMLEPVDWQMAEDYLLGAVKMFEKRTYEN